ncbi:S8 family peptidase [Natrialbaceae archaeon A-CW1-1]
MADNSMSREHVSRRTLLKGVGAGVATTALAGQATAQNDDEYIVGLEAGASFDVAKKQANGVRFELDFGGIGKAVSGRFSDAALEALGNSPNVRYVEPNGRMHALQTTPYGIEQVDADVAIGDGETGAGANIAVIDTGIDPQHETLAENLGEGWAADDAECDADCGGGPFGGGNDIDECLEVWDDDNDHGSHCAGTAAAADNGEGVLGVAPDATLHAVKVLDCSGGGSWDGVAAGITWAADQNQVDILSMSLGGDASDVVHDAVQYADQQGKVQVAAAGNDGPCTDCVGYPAAHDEVIAVSASDENDDLADFSSTGPEVDLAAPGVDTLSTVPRDDYAEFSGTSMACPHVSGAAATLIGAGYDHSEVRQVLKDGADDIGLGDNEQGAGRLNVANSLGIEGDDGDDDDGDGGDDGDDGDDTGDNAPDIDQFDVAARGSGPWSRADVDWAVSDEDGDLDNVTTELLDGSSVLDSQTSSVSGSSASGEHEVRTRDDPDSVRLTVTDEAGNETSETQDF